jgi:hypothetical protein
MTNLRKIIYQEVYLFDDSINEKKFKNSLKEFIYYIRFTGIKGVIDFAYSSNMDTIHPSLSIKDNFILDSVPTSLIKNKEDNFRYRLKEIENKPLVNLITTLEPIERKASELDLEQIKLASILKSLLAQTDYVFLECPDENLSIENLNKIKECLEYEVKINNRKVFIKPYNNDAWIDLATDIVTKNQKQEYVKSQNLLSQLFETKVDVKPNYNFTLAKKAS